MKENAVFTVLLQRSANHMIRVSYAAPVAKLKLCTALPLAPSEICRYHGGQTVSSGT